jgi:ribose-phosphate pyrophosphokinase
MKLVTRNFEDIYTPNVEIGKFPDGDTHMRIPNISDYANKQVTVFHRLYKHQNSALLALLLILETLREINAEVTVVAPYLPYARQDKQTIDGEVASARIICGLLAKAGCKKFVTFDCHFLNQEGEAEYNGLLIQNISMSDLLIEHAKTFFAGQPFEIIGPDEGADYLVKGAGGKSMKKIRKAYEKDAIAYRHIESMDGELDVKDKNVLLLDDMISTGSTMLKALEKIRENGAKKIACAATHGLFLHDSLVKIQKFADTVFSTDTILTKQSEVSIRGKIAAFDLEAPTLF